MKLKYKKKSLTKLNLETDDCLVIYHHIPPVLGIKIFFLHCLRIFSSQPFNFELTTVSEISYVTNMFFSPFWIFPFSNSIEILFFSLQ